MNKNYSEKELKSIRESAFINDRIEPVMAPHVMNLVDQLLEVSPAGGLQLEDAEKEVLEMTNDLREKFKKLPELNQADSEDFDTALRIIQRIITWRPFIRDGGINVE